MQEKRSKREGGGQVRAGGDPGEEGKERCRAVINFGGGSRNRNSFSPLKSTSATAALLADVHRESIYLSIYVVIYIYFILPHFYLL